MASSLQRFAQGLSSNETNWSKLMSDGQPGRGDPRAVLMASIPLGIGLVGALDEIVFHQLLQWHNFYVDASDRWRIFSDGLLHAFTLSMLFFGAYRLWQERQVFSDIVSSKPFWAGVLLGGGGFQLWDGIVDHKLLRLHPVREETGNILMYDIAWIASSLVLLVIGWSIWRSIEPEHVSEPAVQPERPRRQSKA